MPDNNETSEELLALIGKGDAAAEKRLIERYNRPVLYLLINRTDDQELAKDISQETFRVLLEKFRSHGANVLDDPAKLNSYVLNTAVNLLLAEVRKKARRNTEFDSDLIAEIAGESSPFNDLDQLWIKQSIEACIRELKHERDRIILFRYHIQDKSKAEVCMELDLDNRHFDKVIYRARERLRKVVENRMEGTLSELFGKKGD